MNGVLHGGKRKLILAATIVLLAVILVNYGYGYIQTEVVAQKLYEESLNYQDRGDVEKAKLKLTEIIKIDSSYKDVKERLALLRRSSVDNQYNLRDQSNEKSGSDLNTDTDSVANNEIIPGYRLVNSSSNDVEDVRNYKINIKESALTEATVTTRRYQSESDAVNAIGLLRNKYPRNQQIIWINGRMVYYGNDGKKTSLLVWEENATTAEIIGMVDEGPPGAALGSMKVLARRGN